VFSTENEGIIEPELVTEEQKNKKLVDISVIRRGLNYHGANERNLKQEKDDILKEEQLQEREKAIANKNQNTFSKEEKKKAEDAHKAAAAEEDEREGKLKMVEVQNLPDDVDMIVS
jgi:hypothetical protein